MTKKTSVQCEKFDFAIGRLANIYYSYVLPGLISAEFNIISKGKGNVFIHFQFEITLENQFFLVVIHHRKTNLKSSKINYISQVHISNLIF